MALVTTWAALLCHVETTWLLKRIEHEHEADNIAGSALNIGGTVAIQSTRDDLRLEDVLLTKEGFEAMCRYLVQEFVECLCLCLCLHSARTVSEQSLENLLCYVELTKFLSEVGVDEREEYDHHLRKVVQHLPQPRSLEDHGERFKCLWNKYLRPHAEFEVNMSYVLKHRAEAGLPDADSERASLINAIRSELLGLMLYSFARFRRSDEYRKLQDVMTKKIQIIKISRSGMPTSMSGDRDAETGSLVPVNRDEKQAVLTPQHQKLSLLGSNFAMYGRAAPMAFVTSDDSPLLFSPTQKQYVSADVPSRVGPQSVSVAGAKCHSVVAECSFMLRIQDALSFYQKLDIANDLSELTRYCKEEQPTLIDDFHHILSEHSKQDDMAYFEALECTMSGDCALAARYHRSKEQEDDKQESVFCRDLLDSVHCYVFHLYDFGFRVKGIDTKLDQPVGDDCVDVQFNAVYKQLHGTKDARAQTDKYNLSIDTSADQNSSGLYSSL